MKRIHFDSKGPVKWHYFFWEPWGCAGCFLRVAAFVALLALFLFLMSQFRSCRSSGPADTGSTPPVSDVVPPINEDDVIDDDGHQLVANRLNVLFDSETGQAEYESWVSQFTQMYPAPDYQILFYDPNTKLMSIQVPAERRVEMITELPERIPDIPFMVFEESVMETGLHPDDPVFTRPEHAYCFDAIKAYDAWDITMGSPAVTVAVVDSYFDIYSSEFEGLDIVMPYSVARGDSIVALPPDFVPSNPDMVYAHGTMVAGLAVGATGNGTASAGMAPSCRFMPISLSHRFGCLAMLQGILYAINHRATVINISAGISFTEEVASWPVEQQVQMARTELLAQEAVWRYVFDMAKRNYVTIVWAAGNENVFTALDASKRGENTIKVSAVDRTMSKAEFSNFGNIPEDSIYESTISAPGVQVPGIIAHTSGYTLVDGTSFSAPLVSGCVGLIKSLDPTLTTGEIIQLIQSTARPVAGAGANSSIGPVIQIGPALQQLQNSLCNYSALAQSLLNGTGSSYRACLIEYLVIEDPTALPPIYTMEIIPTGTATGKIRYIPNRSNMEPLEASYTVVQRNNKLIINAQSTGQASGDEGVSFGPAVFTISANQSGKAVVTSVEAEWWSDFEPFMIKPQPQV